MTHVLVTGGAGMIGTALVRRLLAEGMRVSVVDNLWRGRREWLAAAGLDLETEFHAADLARPGVLDPLLPGVDYVVHLADVVAGIGYVFANQGFILRQNLLINAHVAAAVAQARHLRGYVYVGTACSFPQARQSGPEAAPLREEELFPAAPESAYGWSKLMGQIEAGLLEREAGIPVALPMLHNVYGAPCDFGRERAQVIPALVRRAVEYPQAGPFTVWGTGAQGRAFVHVEDAVEGLVAAMDRGLGRGPIQLGPDRCTTIREIAETVVAVSGKPIAIGYDSTKPTGDLGRCADYAKARALLGWAPRVALRDGIAELYGWIERQLRAGGPA
jgi:GDP-D-mannose 3',5'-epimerase